jgi:hypothetical protein
VIAEGKDVDELRCLHDDEVLFVDLALGMLINRVYCEFNGR